MKMQLTHLTILLTIVSAPALTQKLDPNALKSILQDMLSPKNAEQTIQILTSMANKKRSIMPNLSGPVTRRFSIAGNLPRADVRNQVIPNKVLMQRQELPKNVIVQKSNNIIMQQGKQIVLPKNMVMQRGNEMVLPKNMIIQKGGEANLPRNVIVRRNEMPKRMLIQNGNDFRQKECVQQKVLVNQPAMTEYLTAPQKTIYARNEKPFLPAASPVSASPASRVLAPAVPQSRGQFLRKIPICPPTL